MDLKAHQPILFFDSDCVLCSRIVNFILKNEKSQSLKFASLQGEVFQELQKSYEIPDGVDSTILLENGQVSIESKAAISLGKYLKAPYSFVSIFKIIPSFILDALYKFIARNRYDWFGTCAFVPEAGDRYIQSL